MEVKENVDPGIVAGEVDELDQLREALEYERLKNQVLVEQLVGLEDMLAASDAAAYEDVIPDEDREYWGEQLLANRDAAIGFLGRLRNRLASEVVAAPAVAPAAAPAVVPVAAPAVVPPPVLAFPPKPMHNRAAAKPAVAEAVSAPGGDAAARCARIANRSRELVRSHGISFDAAWRRAESELGEGR